MNICKFSLIWQSSEYARICNYERVLNVPEFQVFKISAYARVAQGSEYEWIMPYSRDLNMPGQHFTGFK